jgi:hypothetical protein
MGRPIERRFFGDQGSNVNTGNTGNVGGEGVASVALSVSTLSGMTPGTYAIPAASITRPQIAGGSKPVLSLVVTGATAATVTVVSSGAGYTSAPTITGTGFGALAGGSGGATATPTMTTTRGNAIAPQAWITGDSQARTADIIKQTGARSFLVATTNGSSDYTGKCVLVPNAPAAAGQMSITATKADASTFYVRKITGRKVWDTTGVAYSWTLGSASGSVVSLANV